MASDAAAAAAAAALWVLSCSRCWSLSQSQSGFLQDAAVVDSDLFLGPPASSQLSSGVFVIRSVVCFTAMPVMPMEDLPTWVCSSANCSCSLILDACKMDLWKFKGIVCGCRLGDQWRKGLGVIVDAIS